MSNKNIGCLGAIFQLLGMIPKDINTTEETLPYAKRDDFLSAAELSFFKVLQQAIGDKVVVCTKVSLKDLFFAKTNDKSKKATYTNQINRKHVDFLLCTSDNVKPICGIELDDSSHQRKDRIERDQFVEKVFASAGLPLVRFQTKHSYSVQEIIDNLGGYLHSNQNKKDEADSTSVKEVAATVDALSIGSLENVVPICKKCGLSMVLRTAKKGENKGASFYGCVNYPKCKETVQL